MTLAGLDAKAAASDPFGLANYNKLKDDIDYLVVAGADLASAATIAPTAEFHKVTGTTTIDSLNYVGAVAGQQVRLWCESIVTIRNNGGGTGNIRTRAGVDRRVHPNEIVTFVYDGTYWREQDNLSNPIARGDRVANVSTTGTTFAAGADLLAAALSFVADGQSYYLLTASANSWNAGGGTAYLEVNLDGSAAGLMAMEAHDTTAARTLCARGLVLSGGGVISAGAHTVNARLYTNSGTVTVGGGTGAAGAAGPIVVTLERMAT